MKKPHEGKTTRGGKAIAPKPSDPADDIRAAWHGLYRLGDDALARSKEAAEKGDMTALMDAQASFALVRDALQKLRPLGDLAFLARKFKMGRKPSTGSPIRKAIAKVLKENPDFKNPDLWAKLSANPPKGWNFFNNRAGRYIEGPNFAEDHMVYRRFCTVCGEERKNLKP
ncbi:MAG: hypothetical protein Q7T21_03105 [Gallionella sp.]|nr:hypothetical protein [Gallionella sp.]